jgi:hypothetical protein
MAQNTRNESITIGATSVQVAPTVNKSVKRSQLIITNTSAAAVATVVKGDLVAVSGVGIILQPNGVYIEATDGGYTCYQGPIQCVGNGAGTVVIVETFEDI